MKALLLPLLVLTLNSCYLTRQAYYQNNLINSRRPVAHVLAEPDLPEPARQKLQLLGEVKAYAALHGLNSEGAYDSYVDNGSGAMSYLVFAAPIDQLKAKTWWFPIVGSVPYLGYFEEADRDSKQAQLDAEGLDTYAGRSMAFSSLGYFEDPIYSSQFPYDDELFSHTIFHELVHRTIWVPGSTRFNENLAEFIADTLNRKFLGPAAKNQDRLARRVARKKRYITFVKEAKEALGAFYTGDGKGLAARDRSEFLARREKILAAVQEKYYKPAKAGQDKRRRRWNNASLLAASLYLPDYDSFAKAYTCAGSEVPKFIEALKRAIANGDGDGKPEALLASLCTSNPSIAS